jgi:hypothetical protein
MEATAAVPVERAKPGPLSALALLVAVPATLALPLWESRPIGNWSGAPQVWLTILAGGAIVVLVGRRTFGVARSLALLITSSLALAFSFVVFFAIGFSQAFACGGQTYHPLHAWIAIAAGVVYGGVGFSALRKGWWWGLAIAFVVALIVFAGLTFASPGQPATDDCSPD